MIGVDLESAANEIHLAETQLVDALGPTGQLKEYGHVFLSLARAKRFLIRARKEYKGERYKGGLHPQAVTEEIS